MAATFQGYFYMLYFYENEQPAAVIESIEELRQFLGHKTRGVTRSSLCHYKTGQIKYLRDAENRRYTIAKIED